MASAHGDAITSEQVASGLLYLALGCGCLIFIAGAVVGALCAWWLG